MGAALALGVGGAAWAAGELRIANSGEPDTLDPHHVSGTWENRIIGDCSSASPPRPRTRA